MVTLHHRVPHHWVHAEWAHARSMTSSSLSSSLISPRVLTRLTAPGPTSGATATIASRMMPCSSSLLFFASLPPYIRTLHFKAVTGLFS